MSRHHDCLFCEETFKTAKAHMLHMAVHPDRIGTRQRSRRPWSCWACATENRPDVTTCAHCGWEQIVTSLASNTADV